MDADQFRELEDRLEKVERDVLERLDTLENKGSWLSRHLGVVVSTVTILATLAAGWGRIETNMAALHRTDISLQDQVTRNTGLIREHHENTSVHTDRGWRQEIRQELSDIRNLLIQHMQTNGKAVR